MPPTGRAGPWLPMGRGAMAATILAADKDLLHPARRPVGVEGQVLETQEVTQPLLSVHRQEQAGVVRGEQGRVNALEPRPGERERLRQLSGQVCGRIGVAGRGVPDLTPRIAHRPMISRCPPSENFAGCGGGARGRVRGAGRDTPQVASPARRPASSPGAHPAPAREQGRVRRAATIDAGNLASPRGTQRSHGTLRVLVYWGVLVGGGWRGSTVTAVP